MYMERFKKAETLVKRMEIADKIQEAFREYPNHTKIVITNPGASITLEPSGFGKELIEDFKEVVDKRTEKVLAEFAEL